MAPTIEQKLKKYFELTSLALKKVKIVEIHKKQASDLLDLSQRYFKDAKHFEEKGDLVNALDKHLVLDGDKMKWKSDSPFKTNKPHKKITDIVAIPGTDRTLKEKLPSRKSLKKSVKPNEKLKKLRRELLVELKKLRESKQEPTLPQALLYNKYKTELGKNKIKPKDDKVAVEFVRISKERF